MRAVTSSQVVKVMALHTRAGPQPWEDTRPRIKGLQCWVLQSPLTVPTLHRPGECWGKEALGAGLQGGGRKEQGDEKGSLPGVRGGMDAATCRVLGSRDHHFLVSSLGRKVFLDMSCSHLTSSRLRTRIKCITLSPLGRRLMLGSPVGRWSTQGKQS